MMAIKLDTPTGTWQKQTLASGVAQFIWKDTVDNIFLDTTACIWLDRAIELIERLTGIEGVSEKQTKPTDGGVKLSRPSGTWIKQDKPS